MASDTGKGSTFAFFIKTHRSEPTINQDLEAKISSSARSSLLSKSKADSAIDVNMTEASEPYRKTKILVVEDNNVNQLILKKQLIRHGYEVYVASNGQEALDWLTSPSQTVQVDVILMDVEMPVMGGLACAKKIREWEKHSSISSNATCGDTSSLRPKPIRGSSFNSIRSLNSVSSSNPEDGGNATQNRIPIIAISANARPEQVNDAILSGMDDSIAKPFRVVDLTPRIDHLLNSFARSGRA